MNPADYIAGDKDAGFTFGECFKSDTADREGVDNTPPADLIPVIAATAAGVLMPLRTHFAIPFAPLSFFRSRALERLICAKAIERVREAARKAAVVRPNKATAAPLAMDAAESKYLDGKQHPKGNAVDFRIPRVSLVDAGRWFERSGLPFDQMIFEFYNPANLAAGWLHISLVDGNHNRRMILTTADGATYAGGYPATV